MLINGEEEHRKIVLNLFKSTNQGELNYVYRGSFTQTITDHLIELSELGVRHADDPISVKKRVYQIMVEGLQNISKHQDEIKHTIEIPGFFNIQKKAGVFLITTANLISNNRIHILENHIKQINTLNKEELKEYYRKVLAQGELSNKGGAGLGLIDIARKAEGKLYYQFEKFNDDYSFFYMLSEIYQQIDNSTNNQQNSIDDTIILHKYLTEYDIIFIINSYFEQDSMLSLLSIIERQVNEVFVSRKKVFNIMVEMIQNIIHHGYSQNPTVGTPGIFIIGEAILPDETELMKEHYILYTGNYVSNSNIPEVKRKIDNLNKLNDEELNEVYSNSLLDFDIDENTIAGLGLIDIRIKSGSKIEYTFHEINQEISFYTFRICVLKN